MTVVLFEGSASNVDPAGMLDPAAIARQIELPAMVVQQLVLDDLLVAAAKQDQAL